MAEAFYLDFTVTLYTTKTVMADSEEEATKIAQKLSDSYSFFENELLPAFHEADIVYENMYMDDNNPGYYVSIMGIDGEPDHNERYMTTEQIAEYIDKEG